MKDYYKILGVRKNASEEEIRERWVELMRKLHPDQQIERTAEDERIKEINEVYQVLKHSSTRVEYDLKRAYDQRKRKSYFRRLSIPIAIFVVFVIIGTIYLGRPQVTFQANLPTQDRINPIDPISQIDETNQTDLSREMGNLFHGDQIDQPNQNPVISNQRTVISSQTNQINQKNQTDQKDQINKADATPQRNKDTLSAKSSTPIKTPSTQRRHDSTMPKLDEASKPTTQLPNNLMTQSPDDSITRSNEIDQTNVPNVSLMTQLPNDSITRSNKKDQINQTDQRNQKDASSYQRIDAFTPMIATEGEVRRFFANYTERYTQRDLDSFISLFSSRAVQNRQDGLEGIRKIYDNFLGQSQEIQYAIDHIKIEIYENAVEVKARYKLVQMMKKSGDKRVWRGDVRWSLIKEEGVLKILSLDYQHQKSP